METEVKEKTQQLQNTLTGLENQLSQLSLKHSEDVERATERLRQMETTVSVHITAGLYTPYLPPPKPFYTESGHEAQIHTVDQCWLVLYSNTLQMYVCSISLKHQKDLEETQNTQKSLVTEELNSQKEKLQRAAMEERAELEKKLEDLQKLLDVERERLQTLQKSLECEENPQLMAAKQKLQAQHDREMNTAKAAMAAEVKELNALLQDQMEGKLQDALCRSVMFYLM